MRGSLASKRTAPTCARRISIRLYARGPRAPPAYSKSVADKAHAPEIAYVGVDISARLIDRATQRYAAPHRLFIRGSATDLPCAAQSFDAVFSIAVWHLLDDPRLAARELARVLKPGGRFRIVTANREAWPKSDKSVEMLHLHSEDEIREALASHGLDVTARETVRHWLQLDGVRP
jgi:SAM-dependent methyltransferase